MPKVPRADAQTPSTDSADFTRPEPARPLELRPSAHLGFSALPELAQMVPMRVVMEILGHSQIHVTMDTYSNVMPELQRDATERVSATIFGAS